MEYYLSRCGDLRKLPSDDDSVRLLTSFETRLITGVRSWLDQPSSDTTPSIAAATEIQYWLEPFIDACLADASYPQTKGWSSDGVIDLTIDRIGMNQVALRGITWLITQTLVPFDIRLTISPHRSDEFQRIEFRIAIRDRGGHPVVHPPDRLVLVPTKESRDWLVAVELTPLTGDQSPPSSEIID